LGQFPKEQYPREEEFVLQEDLGSIFVEKSLYKRNQIFTSSMSSHKGISSPEQKGNDCADRMANYFRCKAESKAAVRYFMESEEKFILMYEDKDVIGVPRVPKCYRVIQGDPRGFLKNMEIKLMLDIGKQSQDRLSGSLNILSKSSTRLRESGSGQLKPEMAGPGFTSSLQLVSGSPPITDCFTMINSLRWAVINANSVSGSKERRLSICGVACISIRTR
jgi:hypothetical protein